MNIRNFLKWILAVASLLVQTPSWADAVSVSVPNPFISSVPTMFLHPQELVPETGEITLYPERSQLPKYGDRNRLVYTYALQPDRNAPLVFVVPGTGGYAAQANTLALAEVAFKLGYSVITIPSTSHWSFAMASSSDGRTGYLPKDGKDNYRLIHTIKLRLEREEKLTPVQYGIMGYSYGALDAEQLVLRDQIQHVFNFNFLILLNPPLNLFTAIKKVDQYYMNGVRKWSDEARLNLMSFALGRTIEISKGQININSLEDLGKAFPLSEEKLSWILGQQFREAIKQSAFVGDVLEGKESSAETAISGTIEDYLKEIVFKPLSIKQNRPVESLMEENNLNTGNPVDGSALASKLKVVLFHAKDDFLSFPEGKNILTQMKIETHIADFGGHLGNLAQPKTIRELSVVLLKVKK